MIGKEFSRKLLAWFDKHGRRDLPWQKKTTPYRVWVSEIMLQQTQVTTVIPYYQRFMARFPSLKSLAQAGQDDVLSLWTGLGYYARGRNLHKAAQHIMQQHGGRFPRDIETVKSLPGIGPSTASAILSLACDQRHSILDGNVKRVLCRYYAIDGWPGKPAVEEELWTLAEQHTPDKRVADYTQAIMDLGATLCRRSKPDCATCPVSKGCQAHALDKVSTYPVPRPRKKIPQRQSQMLLITNPAGEVLLQQRPPSGIWGGLWSLPECPPELSVADWCKQQLDAKVIKETAWPELKHTFSHFQLQITPTRLEVHPENKRVMEPEATVWYKTHHSTQLGLPAPVKRLLQQLAEIEGHTV